ncbi:hypothetical protein [Streptomyces halstedii]|uniref:hypothetical protein n=1 Tax=Streptomyces halstedii TaxID=1944 RepID=UPI003356C73C
MTRSEAHYGSVEQAVRADLAALGDLEGCERSLAQLAYRLAQQIDRAKGEDVRLLPSLSRELRAALKTIDDGRQGDDDEDDLDDLADPS